VAVERVVDRFVTALEAQLVGARPRARLIEQKDHQAAGRRDALLSFRYAPLGTPAPAAPA